jgi:hypothetical protein
MGVIILFSIFSVMNVFNKWLISVDNLLKVYLNRRVKFIAMLKMRKT